MPQRSSKEAMLMTASVDQSQQMLTCSKVLILDSNDVFRNQLTDFFSHRDIEVIELLDPKDAEALFEKFWPDLILIDSSILLKEDKTLLKKAKTRFPNLVTVLLIDTPDPKVHDLLRDEVDTFLCKNIVDINLFEHVLRQCFDMKNTQVSATFYKKRSQEYLEELTVKRRELLKESKDKLLFIHQLSSNIQQPLDQLIQFAHIGLQRIRRKQTLLVGSYLAEVKLISEELMIYINDLKEIAFLKTGESEFSLEETDLGELLKTMHRQFQPIADSRNVLLSSDIDIDNPCVLADYNKLTKVINILLRNSFRYMGDQGEVSMKAIQNGQYVNLAIIDDTLTIPLEEREKLFNMYDQNRLQSHRSIAGFGLSICKELMLGQNGDIWLEPNNNTNGCTFILSLPVAESILD